MEASGACVPLTFPSIHLAFEVGFLSLFAFLQTGPSVPDREIRRESFGGIFPFHKPGHFAKCGKAYRHFFSDRVPWTNKHVPSSTNRSRDPGTGGPITGWTGNGPGEHGTNRGTLAGIRLTTIIRSGVIKLKGNSGKQKSVRTISNSGGVPFPRFRLNWNMKNYTAKLFFRSEIGVKGFFSTIDSALCQKKQRRPVRTCDPELPDSL